MMEICTSDSDVFKKPSTIAEKPPKPKLENIADEQTPSSIATASETSDKSQIIIGLKEPAKPSQIKTPTQPIPYNEPSWGGKPDVLYSLEEMKSGVSLRSIPLDQKSFYCFGRLENCHIVMAHPTISRYHAILQFRSTFSDTDEKKGFYLYDLGSTHGTFLNKERIKPKTYVKLQVGHMIKFGSSTRFFLLHGPDEDQEEESKYTFTELREMRNQELEKRKQVYLEEKVRLTAEEEDNDSKGIDWGMGEDADEETDLTENPFAVLTNEELYIDDPKKTLRCWFEREGEELKYHVEEKNFGQFRCSVELPLENAGGGFVIAEALVSGKKKEAMYQCALEACRILDRHGLLKQSNQDSRKRKQKNWEEDDYYDSDEDNFFDRTGDLEAKRKQRMNQIKRNQEAPDTYETLIEKHRNVLKEIQDTEHKLNVMLLNANRSSHDDEEDVDSFMLNKSSGQVLDKLELKKYRNLLSSLKNDEERLRKLINFVKPFELPEIRQPTVTVISTNKEDSSTIEIQNSTKNTSALTDCSMDKCDTSQTDEKDTDLSTVGSSTKKPESTNDVSIEKSEEILQESSNIKQIVKKTRKLNDSAASCLENLAKKSSSVKKSKELAQCYSNSNEEDFNNIVWTPPAGQTGDGRTQLNDKLGY